MKGLLIKDVLLLKQMGLQYLFVIGMFAFISIMNKSPGIFSTLICVVPFFVIMNLFTLEGSFPSDMLAMSIPQGRSRVVLSRYLMLLLCILFFALIGTVLFLVCGMDLRDGLPTLALVLSASIVLLSVIIPFIIKLGLVKGRIVLMLMGMIPILIPFLSSQGVSVLEFTTIPGLLWVVLAAAALMFACSAWVSVCIYKRKEI